MKGEAEKEPSSEGVERESFVIASKKGAFLPEDGEGGQLEQGAGGEW